MLSAFFSNQWKFAATAKANAWMENQMGAAAPRRKTKLAGAGLHFPKLTGRGSAVFASDPFPKRFCAFQHPFNQTCLGPPLYKLRLNCFFRVIPEQNFFASLQERTNDASGKRKVPARPGPAFRKQKDSVDDKMFVWGCVSVLSI